ncbi:MULTISPECIES: TonB-dependent receptor [Niastella]|uniref:TonB-dependent receptor n=1 Tax=Niastella soli TaxID=2821487 RepID=A0ABS3Z0R9_9BACT|nr:TonB-dependent receptor [Niastella soli]MBO9203764.1 TonB-dependent receptor [Niastella soli]
MKIWMLLIACLFYTFSVSAQDIFRVTVRSRSTTQALPGVSVTPTGGRGVVTNDSGQAVISELSAGKHTIQFSSIGYEPFTLTVTLPDTGWHEVLLTAVHKEMEEVTVLASTRNNQRIENSPLKVEVLGKEEMNEENAIKPGNIASILGDVSGIQIQQSSAVSGNSNVRIQGLDGRYTQILRDGMPLFDGFSGGFGIMQIPPLDLKQVELIKGSASTLYGGGAIGGLINLISKRPGYEQEGMFTLNQSTLKESNFNAYVAKRNKKVGYNFFGGVTHQGAVDVNDDSFSDVPKTDAVVLHPRFFIYPDSKTTIALGYTGTFETRNGGDMQVIKGNKDAVHQFFEKNKTDRHTGDLLVDRTIGNGNRLELKASVTSFDREINTNVHHFKGNQLNYFTEASILIPREKYSFVAGVNATGDRFKVLPSDPVLLTNFDNNTVGAFAQGTFNLPVNTTLEAGIRTDHHNNYGNFVLPRIALFHRFNEQWATRLGVGFGYKAPNPLAVQTVDYPIQEIQPLPAGIQAEKSIGYNAEVNFKTELSNESTLFINHAFFLTQINNPVIATEEAAGPVTFNNAGSHILTRGFDTYAQLKLGAWELYAGYTYTIAERKYLKDNQFMPLTPRNRMAFVLVYEIEGTWRFGLEGSYTGTQYRDGDSKTPDYLFTALMVERKLGKKISLVANCENLLDYRQSRHETLYTGSISDPTFKPLWAPIDGRVINCSLRWNWGAK